MVDREIIRTWELLLNCFDNEDLFNALLKELPTEDIKAILEYFGGSENE